MSILCTCPMSAPFSFLHVYTCKRFSIYYIHVCTNQPPTCINHMHMIENEGQLQDDCFGMGPKKA